MQMMERESESDERRSKTVRDDPAPACLGGGAGGGVWFALRCTGTRTRFTWYRYKYCVCSFYFALRATVCVFGLAKQLKHAGRVEGLARR